MKLKTVVIAIIVIIVMAVIAVLVASSINKNKNVDYPALLKIIAKDIKEQENKPIDYVVAVAHHESSGVFVVGRKSGNLDIWSSKAGGTKLTVRAFSARADRITFTSDGSAFFVGSSSFRETKLFDAKSGVVINTLPNVTGTLVSLMVNNLYLVSGSSEFYVYDYKKHTLGTKKHEVSGVIQSMSIDMAHKIIAVGTASGTIDLWQVSMENEIPVLEKIGHSNPYSNGDWVVGLHFSGDGDSLFSVSRSGEVDQRESLTLKRVRAIPSKLKAIMYVKFDDAKQLVAMGGKINLYPKYDDKDKGGFAVVVSLPTGEVLRENKSIDVPIIEIIDSSSLLVSVDQKTLKTYDLIDL